MEKTDIISKKRGHTTPCRTTWRNASVSQEAEGTREAWAETFIVVSVRKAMQGRVSRVRINEFE